MAENFIQLLQEWKGSEVTVVNPESFKSSQLGKGLTFQTYPAKVGVVGNDYITLSFEARKQDTDMTVEQVVPLDKIKRLTIWGEEKLIHL